jgi:menaquinone-dependent protoporphyrinogen oxidase
MTRILVAYATKHGATAQIAQSIGEKLQHQHHQVDVLPVEDVTDVVQYDAFVVGSAVYIGQWRKEAARFLEEHETLLSKRDVWLFSSGPTGEGDAEELLQGWHFPEKLQPLADRIQPHDIVIFHGVLDKAELNFIERFMIRGVKAPLGDFREWDSIETWAQAIAAKIQ